MEEDGQVGWRDGLEERSRRRRERLVAHGANSHQDAEEWDLDFWPSRTPEANNRVDLLVLWPVLLIVSVVAIVKALR